MFDIGWSELLLVAVLAIVFIAPKDLPRAMRTMGQLLAKARAMARDFQQSFEDMARETELEELRRELAELRGQAGRPLDAPVTKPRPAPSAIQEPAQDPLPVEDLPAEMADAIREAEAVENYPLPLRTNDEDGDIEAPATRATKKEDASGGRHS